jgi:nitrogen regulatory protein PII-like uncharacterized protein
MYSDYSNQAVDVFLVSNEELVKKVPSLLLTEILNQEDVHDRYDIKHDQVDQIVDH